MAKTNEHSKSYRRCSSGRSITSGKSGRARRCVDLDILGIVIFSIFMVLVIIGIYIAFSILFP